MKNHSLILLLENLFNKTKEHQIYTDQVSKKTWQSICCLVFFNKTVLKVKNKTFSFAGTFSIEKSE